ncbi:MAG TPA: GNAT family N-acetyltransferase [Micromonosporaceae bacterium]|nr:GNAT family N-acetyltransferase [Micromonosporaceae bacterium]
MIWFQPLYFLLLKHDMLGAQASALPGIYWRPLIGPRAIDARMIRATTFVNGGNHTIGEISYQVCRTCRLGMIWKVSTNADWQRNGIATAMVERARRDAGGYAWRTSEQLPDAVPFWEKIAVRTGLGYQEGEECKHMRRVGLVNARDRIHLYPGGRY